MNKLILIILSFFFFILSYGQEITKAQKIEKLKAQKIAFITNKLNLSSIEAQQFWPVYNDFFKHKELLNLKKKKISRELQANWQNYPEDKKTLLVDNLISFKLKEAQLELEYHQKFKEVLSIDKVINLYKAENQFKTFLLKNIKGQSNKNIHSSKREFQRK